MVVVLVFALGLVLFMKLAQVEHEGDRANEMSAF